MTEIGDEIARLAAARGRLAEQRQAERGPARNWAVVLYSGECDEHIGLRCAIGAVAPCTLAESEQVAGALPPGFAPHRVRLMDAAEILETGVPGPDTARPGPAPGPVPP